MVLLYKFLYESMEGRYLKLSTILCLYFLFLSTFSFSQQAVTLNFNTSTLREGLVIGYAKSFGDNHKVELGLRYQINNKAMPDDQEHIYYKRIYATSGIQHFGIQFGYSWFFAPNLVHLNPFLFYDCQLAYSTTRNHGYGWTYYYDEGSLIPIEEYTVSFGPFHWIQNTIGIGCEVDIWKSYYLFEKIGFNSTLIIGNDENLVPDPFQSFSWGVNEFGYLVCFGIGRRF